MASDYITEHGYIVKDACTWNKGKKCQKEPKALHKVNYPSSKRIAADSLYNWDPCPPELRQCDRNLCNQFVLDLKKISAECGKISMWETSLSYYEYEDFTVEDNDKGICISLVAQFEENISCHTEIYCGKEYASQVQDTFRLNFAK